MVKIREKKEIKSVRNENELWVENKYEKKEGKEAEKSKLDKWLEELDRLWMSNLENEWRSYFYKDEVIGILNSLID